MVKRSYCFFLMYYVVECEETGLNQCWNGSRGVSCCVNFSVNVHLNNKCYTLCLVVFTSFFSLVPITLRLKNGAITFANVLETCFLMNPWGLISIFFFAIYVPIDLFQVQNIPSGSWFFEAAMYLIQGNKYQRWCIHTVMYKFEHVLVSSFLVLNCLVEFASRKFGGKQNFSSICF